MLSLLLLASLSLAVPYDAAPHHSSYNERALQVLTSAYAPVNVACPARSLVRPASGISTAEAAFVNSRKSNASKSLAAWLAKLQSGFVAPSKSPTLALATSGGGLRSLLCGAGVHQAFDARDGNVSTSGLYQAFTYESGLSGGGWLLGSITGNNWPTITQLRTGLWESTFADSLLLPDNLLAATAYAQITNDILAKQAAGYDTTLVDPYGRLLGYELLLGSDGGVIDTISGLSSLSNFTSFNVPYPIITSIGVKTSEGQCLPAANGTQYEFSPYSFGSWDKGVEAFVETKYLGTDFTAGQPLSSSCTTNYDNLGYIMGTTSNLFSELCITVPPTNDTSQLVDVLEGIVVKAHEATTMDEYALYRNPFYHYAQSPLVANDTELSLVDGGLSDENIPIWPFLHRDVDVLFAQDNSADTSDNYPDGTGIYDTYMQAKAQGLSRMPVIPPPATFISNGFNKRPTFFGCNTNSTLTIIYIPNHNYTYNSGQSTFKLQYTAAETDAMISNGVQIGSEGGNKAFGPCVACAILKKSGAALPALCTQCFASYCYN